MALEWSPALLIGNTQIDEQHQMIFQILGRLRAAIATQEGGDELGRALAAIALFVVGHFRMEEALMDQFGYGRAVEHGQAHESLRLQVEQMVDQFHAGDLQAEGLVDFLEGWLEDHLQGEDLALAQFLAGGAEATG